MTFGYELSGRLKDTLRVLSKRNPVLALEVNRKIKQILASDETSIDHYKNLKHGLSDYKRVHVGKSFVLFFKAYRKEKFVFFDRLVHHDDAYRR